jgi:hypothetical protein
MARYRERNSPNPCTVCNKRKGRRFTFYPKEWKDPVSYHCLCREHLIIWLKENDAVIYSTRYVWNAHYQEGAHKIYEGK